MKQILTIFFQLLALIFFIAAHYLISIYYYYNVQYIVYYTNKPIVVGISDIVLIPAIILQIITILMGVINYGSKQNK